MESRPGAAGVLYLEFSGATVQDSYWNFKDGIRVFTVAESGLSSTQMLQIYEVVKEDYLPFNINVTTKKQLYEQQYEARGAEGPPYKRMRCIVTPTDQWLALWAPGSMGRGIANAGSFTLAGVPGSGRQSDIPYFVFIADFDPSGNISESPIQLGAEVSHEFGHTLGLDHDTCNYMAVGVPIACGPYFLGTGRGLSGGPVANVNGDPAGRWNVWSPIMGYNEGGFITQWSQGQYLGYTLEHFDLGWQLNADDVGVIAGLSSGGNALGYAADEAGPDVSTAMNVVVSGTSLSASGTIGRTANGAQDIDVLRVVIPSGATLELRVVPAEPFPRSDALQAQRLNLGMANLFMKASLLDANGTLLQELAAGSQAYVGSGSPPDSNSLNPTEFLRRRLQPRTMAAGTYHLKIEPSGYGNAYATPTTSKIPGSSETNPLYRVDDLAAGFTSYGSMGAYVVTGSLTYQIAITSALTASATVGVPFAYQTTASNNPTSFSASGLPSNLILHPSTGLMSGTPAAAGTFSIDLLTGNGYASTSQTLVLTVEPGGPLATAVDSASTWTPGGNAAWIGQSLVTHDGIDAAQSGVITHSQHSWMETAVMGPATVSFWWKVSSEATFDFLEFSIDGALQPGRISGEMNWQQQTYGLTAGSHTLRWRYTKDVSRSAGSDVGWVDQFVYAGTSPVITSGGVATGVEGQAFTYQITAVGEPVTYDAVGLPGGLSVNVSSGLVSGIPAVAGISNVTVIATSPVGSGNRVVALTVRPTLNNAVDNPALALSSSGAAPWFGQQALAINLGDAAQSGPIAHNQQSGLSTPVTGPGQLTFLWHTECEAINDYCKFEIDGVEQKRLSGVSSWFNESVAVAAGAHVATWTYVKNGSVSAGTDAAYLDQVAIVGSIPSLTSPLTMNLTVGIGGAYDLTADNNPTSFSVDGPLPPGAWFYSPTIHSIIAIAPSRAGVYAVPVSITNVIGTTHTNVTFNIETAYSGWARERGLSGANAQPTADGDRDGISNLREMAFNLNPNLRDDGFQPLSTDPTTKRLKAAFQRNSTYADLIYEVQISTDLSTWTSIARSSDGGAVLNLGGAFSVSEVQVPTPPYQWSNVVVLDATTLTTGIRRFLRTKITQQ